MYLGMVSEHVMVYYSEQTHVLIKYRYPVSRLTMRCIINWKNFVCRNFRLFNFQEILFLLLEHMTKIYTHTIIMVLKSLLNSSFSLQVTSKIKLYDVWYMSVTF